MGGMGADPVGARPEARFPPGVEPVIVDKFGTMQTQIARGPMAGRGDPVSASQRPFKPVDPVSRYPTPDEKALKETQREVARQARQDGPAVGGNERHDRPQTEFERARRDRPDTAPSADPTRPPVGRPPPMAGLSATFLAQQIAGGPSTQTGTAAPNGGGAAAPSSSDWRRGHALYQQVQETGAPGGFSKPDGVDYLVGDETVVGGGLNLRA